LVDMSKNLTHDLIKGDHFIFILITQSTQELLKKKVEQINLKLSIRIKYQGKN